MVFSTLSVLFLSSINAYSNPLHAPNPQTIAKARALVSVMQENPRGPYLHLRWHCNDGTDFPPRQYACRDHGGGHQYAVYSKERQALADLGWSVGTIYTALSFDEFWDEENRHQRMRELALEQFMIDIDDGWILRKARDYRGRVQIEDEERFGRELLLKLLDKPAWIDQNYLLVQELFRVVPHGSGGDLPRKVRRSAQDIAELEPSFEPLRIEIHTTPSSKSIDRVAAWLDKQQKKNLAPNVSKMCELLLQQMHELYGGSGRHKRILDFRATVNKVPEFSSLSKLIKPVEAETGLDRLVRLAKSLAEIRRLNNSSSLNALRRMVLFDGSRDLETELRLLAIEMLEQVHYTRADLLSMADALVDASFGVGLLTQGERQTLQKSIASIQGKESVSVEDYLFVSRYLNNVGNWAVGTVRYHFAEPLVRYSALDHRAITFIDDLLRGSIVLQLAEVSRRLGFDAQQFAGINKLVFDKPAPALMALNPGLARGRLRVLNETDLNDQSHILRSDIVAIPQTVSELTPVAGVLTMGEGNVLSHVQMLARNFGIPNVTLTPRIFESLKEHDGKDVVLASGSDGSIVLQLSSALTEKQRNQFASNNIQSSEKLHVPRVDLSVASPLSLKQVNKSLSGKVVGPKAANLGELNQMFPGRVSPAIAIPFGMFLQNVNQNPATQWSQLTTLYSQFQAEEINDAQLATALEKLRENIVSLSLDEASKQAIQTLMEKEFGEDKPGVFIRSDTNAEDLPGFTGAGLYETLPNIVGFEKQMKSIPQVWASILSPRAIAWREGLLANPDYVFPSVLLMLSTRVEKSGVMVTRDLVHRTKGLTVSTGWGAGGAVAGETSETLILKPDNTTYLVSEAKAAWQRTLPTTGGVTWVPANDGPVLTAPEIEQLRELAEEVEQKYEPVVDGNQNLLPWDIEFGFINGRLTLFQIRPLIEHKVARADGFILASRKARAGLPETIKLSAVPDAPEGAH